MIEYDHAVIRKHAEMLYRQAGQVVVIYTILGVIIGVIAGMSTRAQQGALIGATVLGFLGFLIGRARSFQLRLQAQTALCQAAIEQNTRATLQGDLPPC